MSNPQAVNQGQRPAIQVHGLEKSFKELRVLRRADFDGASGAVSRPGGAAGEAAGH